MRDAVSMPHAVPVAGSGSAATSSQATMTYHRRPLALDADGLDATLHGPVLVHADVSDAWRRTRVTGSCGVESQRHPSPSLGKSTVSNQFTRKRG